LKYSWDVWCCLRGFLISFFSWLVRGMENFDRSCLKWLVQGKLLPWYEAHFIYPKGNPKTPLSKNWTLLNSGHILTRNSRDYIHKSIWCLIPMILVLFRNQYQFCTYIFLQYNVFFQIFLYILYFKSLTK
jgi:hypothetical protein